MLKNIKNNFENIRNDEGSSSSSGSSSGGGDGIDWCAIAIAACEAGKREHARLAALYLQEYNDAAAMEAKFDEAITQLGKNQQRLDEIKGEYSAFQTEINNAWTSAPDLKNYHTIGEDIECIQNYCAAIGDAITDLTAKKAEWTSKKDTAWTNYQTEDAASKVVCTC